MSYSAVATKASVDPVGSSGAEMTFAEVSGLRARAQVFISLHGPPRKGHIIVEAALFHQVAIAGRPALQSAGGVSTSILKGGVGRHSTAPTALT